MEDQPEEGAAAESQENIEMDSATKIKKIGSNDSNTLMNNQMGGTGLKDQDLDN